MRGAYMRDPQDEIFFPKQYFGENIIQLERIGKTITMRMAHPGEPLEEMGSLTMDELNDEVLIGPYVLAHDPEDTQMARVWNVRISTPVAPDWHPNHLVETISHQDIKRGSRLEKIAIETGKRLVLLESDDELRSPWYSRDGIRLYFSDKQGVYSIGSHAGGPATPVTDASGIQKVNSFGGKYLYYDDIKTYTRQIWRKKRNGSESLQLTHDLEHSWAPQLSPDGKWVAYLALPHDSNPEEITKYQRVSLKILPTTAGSPRTIAHFYGGKGSFDSYAWSPDSKSLVFISTAD
jgi:hypothetical protein